MRVVGNPRIVQTVQLVPVAHPDTTDYQPRPGMSFGQRYSHHRETETNIEGVWELRTLQFHPAYVQSLLDCLSQSSR